MKWKGRAGVRRAPEVVAHVLKSGLSQEEKIEAVNLVHKLVCSDPMTAFQRAILVSRALDPPTTRLLGGMFKRFYFWLHRGLVDKLTAHFS